ncbi:MAG TPA: hypothetical protein GX505_09510 [Clostridiales bacterium]|nr:hypothetical protein [Clostridiales bacterium]
MDYASKIINRINWIPIPNEGWNIEAATEGNEDVLFLNGTWEFTIRDRDKKAGWYSIDEQIRYAWDENEKKLLPLLDYQQDSFESDFYLFQPAYKEWNYIIVPSNWEREAFSKHVFAHCSLIHDDVVGYYRRFFEVPESWDSGRIILQAEGISVSAEVYINEKRVGYHDGGFVPFQMDVTEFIEKGKINLIAIRVVKGDISTVHDSSGQWMMGGIYKDIFLFHVPETHICDFEVKTDYDFLTGIGVADISIKINQQVENDNWQIQTILYAYDTDEILYEYESSLIAGANSHKCHHVFKDILPWSMEEPNLYRLECVLLREGTVIERVREEIGFRRFSADGAVFLLNGKHITIRGVTRHDNLEVRGYALTVGDMIKDIMLMKEANIDGVRSHPYPFDSRFVKLCARYGLLVAVEYCLCGYNSWGNQWTLSEEETYPLPEESFDQNYRKLFNERYHYFAPRIYGRYKNMTAIFAWGLANESGFCEIFIPVARFLYETDKTRFIYAAGERDCADFHYHKEPWYSTIMNNYITADSQHYPESIPPDQISNTLPRWSSKPRPMFYTEAGHPFSNRENFVIDPGFIGEPYGRCIKKAVEAFFSCDNVGGYFIFEWCDQGAMQKGDPASSVSFLNEWRGYISYNQNVKGIVGPNRELKPAYYHIKKAFARIDIECLDVVNEKLILDVKNNYTWLNLSNFRIDVTATNGIVPACLPISIKADIKPGSSKRIEVAVPVSKEIRCYKIEVIDERYGICIQERHFWLQPKPWRGEIVQFNPARPISNQEGILRGFKINNNSLDFIQSLDLTLGAKPGSDKNLYLGMGHLDNLPGDVEKFYHDFSIQSCKLVDFSIQNEIICAKKEYYLESGIIACDFHIYPDNKGTIRIEQNISYNGEPVPVIQLGMKFSVSSYYRKVAWLRNGLWNEYPDKHPDRLFGEIDLEMDEFPTVNPFRYPSFSEAFSIRNVREVIISGQLVPSLYAKALNDGQKLLVISMPSHRRDIYLVLESYGTLPYSEFSFNTRAREDCGATKFTIREAYQGIKRIEPGTKVKNNWEIGILL